MKKKKRRLNGSTAMIAAGFKPVQLWLNPEEHRLLGRAAEKDGRPMAQLLKHYGFEAVKKILENS